MTIVTMFVKQTEKGLFYQCVSEPRQLVFKGWLLFGNFFPIG